MAQQSTRRDRENQIMDTRLERARLNWTRSANSHTGRRHVTSRSRGRTHVSTRPRAALFEKILLAPTGASTHVHDDDVAWPQLGNERLFDIGEKGLAVDRAVDDAGRGEPVATQRRQESERLPFAERRFGDETFASGASAMGAGHVGFRPGLVDEHKPPRIDRRLTRLPPLTPPGDVRPVLF